MSNRDIKGTVFDVQRCSLHDGPGIRTTVFAKGCPLRCVWCHNPESISPEPELTFFVDKCVGCGACAAVCPKKAHLVEDGRRELRRSICRRCFRCVDVCDFDALRVAGREWTVGEVMDLVLRDRIFYEESGGGLTVSGGEPLMQPAFLEALLAETRREGLRTCLDTSGAAGADVFERILPLVDLFLFDYKATDPDRHRELTGADNTAILRNLNRLCRAGATVRLRCPLVPGVNDDDGHLRGIADLCRRYPDLQGVDVMAYHGLAHQKYERFGLDDSLATVSTAADEAVETWLDRLRELGCQRARQG